MNELFTVFVQLKPELENILDFQTQDSIFLRIFEDGSGSVGTTDNKTLNWFVGCVQESVAWDTPEEGAGVLQECLVRLQKSPKHFEFI